jgi:GNAT superfamily N-acetyltransferase
MEKGDVRGVVDVHLRSFPGFFLSFLGPAFLRQLYLGIVDDPAGLAFVSENLNENSGQLDGFIAGTSQPAGFYRRLLHQRWWRFGLASVIPALRSPRIIPRLLRAFTLSSTSAAYGERGALLMSLAVSPDRQSGGLGAALVEAFVEEAKRRGATSVFLTTDRLDNDAVNAFYIRRGFSLTRTFTTPEGREMNEYSNG